MNKSLVCGTVLAIFAMPGIASAECVGRIYHVSGNVVDAKGRPLSTPITFSWVEEHDGRGVQLTTKARKGRYSAEIGFYTQSKSVPGVPVPGGGIYGCNATLKILHYTYASALGKQVVGDIALSGDQTIANLPAAGVVAAQH